MTKGEKFVVGQLSLVDFMQKKTARPQMWSGGLELRVIVLVT